LNKKKAQQTIALATHSQAEILQQVQRKHKNYFKPVTLQNVVKGRTLTPSSGE
jgi:hypothetical protein